MIPRSGTLVSYNLYGIGGVAIGTTLGGYIFRHLTNGIFKYVVYTYIGISGLVILLTATR